MKQIIPRERGTSIVKNKSGKILFVSKNNIEYVLPGGSMEPPESAFEAAIRELREETGIIPLNAKYLFKFKSQLLWINKEDNKTYSTYHTIILIKPKNYKIQPSDDAQYYLWIDPFKLNKFNNGKYILSSHIKIIKKYLKNKNYD